MNEMLPTHGDRDEHHSSMRRHGSDVAEGSKLGAAILLKLAKKLGLSETFAARHLAPGDAGRGQSWRIFSAAMERASLSLDDQKRAVKGAPAAFDHFTVLLENAFPEITFTA